MFGLLGLFGMKLADSMLATMKSVFTYQGRRFLAMFAVTGSQLMYLLLITQMQDGWAAFLVVGLAVMGGQFLGMSVGEKMSKEKTWKMSVSLPREDAIRTARRMRSKNIACQTIKTYVDSPAMTLVAYADDKQQTKEIKKLLPPGSVVEVMEILTKVTISDE